MEIGFNYGRRRYIINDNWFYFLLFICSLIVFLKRKQKMRKLNMVRENPVSPLRHRGGEDTSLPVIVAPDTHKPLPLYHEFDETKSSSLNSVRRYISEYCLGSELGQQKILQGNSNSKRWVPLSQRTKTWDDIKSPINQADEIAVNSVRYKKENQLKN